MNFPVSRLMKDDFIAYYNLDNFSKLIIQYNITGSDTAAYVNLVFYAFDDENNPMHTDPIDLIINSSDPVINISPGFYLGNIEFSRDFIAGALTNPNFSYFAFKAEKSILNYIGFEINANTVLYAKVKNPCPPDCRIAALSYPKGQSN
jgi:hypothetical protein